MPAVRAPVIEAAIHEPTDSSLLVDCVRVLAELRENHGLDQRFLDGKL
jgi:hypothetical protein